VLLLRTGEKKKQEGGGAVWRNKGRGGARIGRRHMCIIFIIIPIDVYRHIIIYNLVFFY